MNKIYLFVEISLRSQVRSAPDATAHLAAFVRAAPEADQLALFKVTNRRRARREQLRWCERHLH